MTLIKEWDQATGHVEVLAVVPDYLAAAYLELLADHSTDHVIYADPSAAAVLRAVPECAS